MFFCGLPKFSNESLTEAFTHRAGQERAMGVDGAKAKTPSSVRFRKMAREAEDNAKKSPAGLVRDGFFRLAAAWFDLAREAKKSGR